MIGINPPRLSMRGIISAAAVFFDVKVNEILSQRREESIVEARAIAMYACRELLPVSYPQIGRVFGNRDHTTVLHACNKIAWQINDPMMRDKVERFIQFCLAMQPDSHPEVDPFEVARRVMTHPAMATNVSIDTIRDFAAIVFAAIKDASGRDEEMEHIKRKLADLQEAFAGIEMQARAFVQAAKSLNCASPRYEPRARQVFDLTASALVEALETNFKEIAK